MLIFLNNTVLTVCFFMYIPPKNRPSRKLCFRQLKIDPERQIEIDPPNITQKPVCIIDNCSHFTLPGKMSGLALRRSLVW